VGILPESDYLPARHAGEKGTCHSGSTQSKQSTSQACRTSVQINFSHNILYVKQLLTQHMPITTQVSQSRHFLPTTQTKKIPHGLVFISRHNRLPDTVRTGQSHYIWKKRLDRQQDLVVWSPSLPRRPWGWIYTISEKTDALHTLKKCWLQHFLSFQTTQTK
jgi:hypothetical protein